MQLRRYRYKLKVRSSVKTALNRKIIDSAWSTFIRMLEYKCRQDGQILQIFLKVDPRKSSQTCSACGFVHPKNRKGKIFCCLHCGYTDDADINAAKVILQRGLAILKSSTAGLAGSDARGEGTDGGTAFGQFYESSLVEVGIPRI